MTSGQILKKLNEFTVLPIVKESSESWPGQQTWPQQSAAILQTNCDRGIACDEDSMTMEKFRY